jgi:hypothetical protein
MMGSIALLLSAAVGLALAARMNVRRPAAALVRTLLVSGLLLVPLTGRAAGPSPASPAASLAGAPTGRAAPAAVEGYAQREAAAKGLETFEGGGSSIYIGGSTVVIVLLLVLLIILL